MSIATYSTSIKPKYSYVFGREGKTLVSDFDGGNEVRRRLWRFPKGTFPISYPPMTIGNRNTLYSFWRQQSAAYKPFWYIDFQSRTWTDEYVGRGGPLPVTGAILLDASASSYVNYTLYANDTAASDFPLLPATNVTSSSDGHFIVHSEKFDKISYTIGTTGAGTYTVGFFYSNSSGGWTSCTGSTGVTDGTSGLKGSGDVLYSAASSCMPGWTIQTIGPSTGSVEGYGIWAKITAYTTLTVQPKASQVTVSSKVFDLHCVGVTTSSLIVYMDGSTSTQPSAIYKTCGAAGADVIAFTAYPSTGCLITADMTGNLRIKGRFGDDRWREEQPHPNYYDNISVVINEVQW